MGGYRTDKPLLDRLQEIVERLHRDGHDSMSDDVEEAMSVIRDGVKRPSIDWIEKSLG